MPAARVAQGISVVVGCLAIIFMWGITSADAAEAPPFYLSFGPDGTSSTEFGGAGAVAIDQESHVAYVIDTLAGELLKFDTNGDPVPFGGSAGYIDGNRIMGLSFFSCIGCSQVAVDPVSHDVYVTSNNSVQAFHADGEPAEFSAGPGVGTNIIEGFGELLGVAVDVEGNIYASDYTSGISIYSNSGESITQMSAPQAANVAVDEQGQVYVNRWHDTVLIFTPTEFPVIASTTYTPDAQPLDPNRANTVTVDPETGDVYVSRNEPAEIAWYDEDGMLLTTFAGVGEEGEIELSAGVAIDAEEEKVFVADLAPNSGLSRVEIFWVSPGPPEIRAVSAADVTSDSATLRATLNPRRSETTYRFEFGLGDCLLGGCTSVPASNVSIGDGARVVSVSQRLSGLQAGTTYHYRVVAENEDGDNLAEEGDHTFTTQAVDLNFQLSDSRAWEMVSPPNKHGALLDGSSTALAQAAADGEALVIPSRGSIEVDPQGNRPPETTTALARRTASGWRSRDTAPSNERVTPVGVGQGGEYKLFSDDLSVGLLEPRTALPLSSEASERTPYLRSNTDPPSYTPLVTEGNVPPGTEFGGNPDSNFSPVQIAGASSNLLHVALSAAVPLVEGAPPAPALSLYLWSAGQKLHPVSVQPAGEGGAIVAGQAIGSGRRTVDHAISEDGSRVFWRQASPAGLFMRDVGIEETARLDVVQVGASGAGAPEPEFQGASADGTVVYFTDPQQLTEDASSSGRDLYRCVIPNGLSASGCSSLVNITAAAVGPGESAGVEQLVSGMGDDGRAVFFVARGVLDSAPNDLGDSAVLGDPNLYVWQEGQGVRFVAVLSEADENSWGRVAGVTEKLSAAASPSGRYLAFMSENSLTGQSNLDAESSQPVEQVFRYDAVADRLDCVSCPPTGGAPSGEKAGSLQLVDPRSQWEGKWIGAVLPEPTIRAVGDASFYSPRAVLDNGRVFFNAVDSLVPADSNGEWDVYQYEPIGVGDCGSSSGAAATARSAGGCLSLISSGTGESEVGFLDASESGNDVFFLTPVRLNEPDQDDELDVYDARVNGTPATLPPRVECLGEVCQPPPVVPQDPTPASAAFEGQGNVRPQSRKHCPKGKRAVRRKGKTRCVAKKPRKHQQRGRVGR